MKLPIISIILVPAVLGLSSCVVETSGSRGGYDDSVPSHSYTGSRAQVHERAYRLGRKDAREGLSLQSSRHSSEYSQADRVAWAESYQNGYYSIPASERGGSRYGSSSGSNSGNYVGGQNYGGTSIEYKRGYNDGLKGSEYDQNRHPQDYKDGYRAGEAARTSGR
jgi:hypothetical protein